MIFFIIGILFILCGIIAAIAGKIDKDTGFIFGGFAACIIGIILVICSCIKTVPTGHTGVVTCFGKVEDYTYEAGVHFDKPWAKVIKMDNRTQKAQIELNCFSSDIQEVTVTYTVNYQIYKSDAQNIYRNIGKDYFNIVVQPKVLEAVKGIFANYNAENLVANRATLSNEIETVLIEDMGVYNIEIVSTSIEDIDFTDAFTDAVEAKQVAEQNKLKAQTEQEQQNLEATAAAERQVIKAQADADAAIIAAQGDAEVAKITADSAEYQGQKDAAIMSNIGKQLQTYPDLVTYYYIQGWDGKLPETVLSNNTNPLINLK